MNSTNSTMRECQRCHTTYQWERSQSALRFTYCGVLCERFDLGFSIDGLIQSELKTVSVMRAAQRIVADFEPVLVAAN